MKQDKKNLLLSTRRGFMLQSGGLMVSAFALSGGLTACSPEVTLPITDAIPNNFSMPQFQLLARVSDLLIPATDTPGALAAGVPEFVDALLSDWALAQTRLDLEAALEMIDERARTDRGKSFLELNESQQVSVLEAHEAAVFSELGGLASAIESDEPTGNGIPGYRGLKGLIYHGYYHSETGCNEELQFQLIPGPEARTDAPLSEVGRTWAA